MGSELCFTSARELADLLRARTVSAREVVAAFLDQIARLNPKTNQWIEYVLPTPWSQDYNSWIDNSTNPVTYWYGDQYGYIVRVQPLE